jgi:serine phosphatase RsbU (regulator of sigma subunit)
LLLLDISRFTSRLEVSENGRAFVLVERESAEELRVVGLPRDQSYADDAALRDALIFVPPEAAVADTDARLPDVDELGVPALEDSVRAWSASGRPEEPFGFSSGGQAWLADLRPYPLGQNTFWIGVALPEQDLLGGVRVQRIALLVIVVLILVVGVARAATLARRFSTPVEALVRETERMGKGDLAPGTPIASNVREFRRLAEAQEGMREGLKARMKLDKIERDLDIARDIQRGLLPTEQPDIPGFAIEGWSQPADQTGGDYFDWMTLPDGRTLITLADVTGHGIGPALIVAVCRAYMRAAASGVDIALARALSQVNGLLSADIPAGRFVTAAVGMLDPASKEITLISAGQAPLFFYHAATGIVENWNADDLPLGIAPELEFESPRRVRFEPGDTLILTTDGFFEWANDEEEQYGIARLEAFIRAHGGQSPRAFIEALHAAVIAHAAGTVQPDDLTCVVVKRNTAQQTSH